MPGFYIPEQYKENPPHLHPGGPALGMFKQNSSGGCTNSLNEALSRFGKTDFAATCSLAERCDQGVLAMSMGSNKSGHLKEDSTGLGSHLKLS